MFFIAYAACVCRTIENCKSLVLQDKWNSEIFLSPALDNYVKPVSVHAENDLP